MTYSFTIETVRPRLLAAVRATTPVSGITSAWKPALDQVWAFLRTHPNIKPGHNFFLYHHCETPDLAMDIDFGVETGQGFTGEGAVTCVETPAGEAVSTLHTGPYSGLPQAHRALQAWCREHNLKIGSSSWEIYGDWTADSRKLETTIQYLLA